MHTTIGPRSLACGAWTAKPAAAEIFSGVRASHPLPLRVGNVVGRPLARSVGRERPVPGAVVGVSVLGALADVVVDAPALAPVDLDDGVLVHAASSAMQRTAGARRKEVTRPP